MVVDGIAELSVFAPLGVIAMTDLLTNGELAAEVDGQSRTVEILNIERHPMVGGCVVVRVSSRHVGYRCG